MIHVLGTVVSTWHTWYNHTSQLDSQIQMLKWSLGARFLLGINTKKEEDEVELGRERRPSKFLAIQGGILWYWSSWYPALGWNSQAFIFIPHSVTRCTLPQGEHVLGWGSLYNWSWLRENWELECLQPAPPAAGQLVFPWRQLWVAHLHVYHGIH